MKFQSTKLSDGFSVAFRQWKAVNTHCKLIHGYGIKVKFVFEGELDHRNWVVDFGGFKRSDTTIDGHLRPKQWLDWLLDHTTIIAEDDPELDKFKELERVGAINLRILPQVGCEMFAKHIFEKFNQWVLTEYQGKVKLVSVEVMEHEKNSAIYRQD